jgi:hypothetical protein
MTWYRTGTVQLTAGSSAVVGTGVAWLSKVKAGDMFVLPDTGDIFEVDHVVAETQLVLGSTYAGASRSTGYFIVPTVAGLRLLASQVADLIALYQQVPDNLDAANAAAAQALVYRNEAANSKDAAASSASSASTSAFAAAADAATSTAAVVTTAANRADALAYRDAAAVSKDAAATSATNAASSASDALASKNAAATSATTAGTSETNALASKNAAATSATNAAASEANASTSASTATTKAAAAATSETNAAGSATSASTKAGEAATSATQALGYRNQTQAIADSIAGSAVTSVAGRTGAVTLTKADVGLTNVDNTPDANKPVSTAQATAIDAKASKGANSDITSLSGLTTALSIAQGGTGGNTAALARVALGTPQLPVGQVLVSLVGANLVAKPYQGNFIMIGGLYFQIPAAGVSLAPTGAAAGTNYFMYLYMNGGTMTAEYSTTGHSTDATTGVEIKTGDPTRTLVARMATEAAGAWVDSPTRRYVANWFNRSLKFALLTHGDFGVFSPTYQEIGGGAARVAMVTWAGDIDLSYTGTGYNNVANTLWYTTIGVDGVLGTPFNLTGDPGVNVYRPVALRRAFLTNAEGIHIGAAYSQDNQVATTTYTSGNALVMSAVI